MLFKTEYAKLKYKPITPIIDEINPLLEIKRQKIINKIFDIFAKVIFEATNKCKCNIFPDNTNIRISLMKDLFSRILFISYSKVDKKKYDPIIPYNMKDSILYDIIKNKLEYKKLNRLIPCVIEYIQKNLNLAELFKNGFDELNNYYNSNEYKDVKNNVVIKKTHIKSDFTEGQHRFTGNAFIFSYGDINIKLNTKLYDKMYKQYDGKAPTDFDTLLFCILLRYDMLRSLNNQLSVRPDEYKKIANHYNVHIELFASSLNNLNKNYFSLFYDLEKYMGSLGSFFRCKLISGNYLMNPPFETYIIDLAYYNIIKSLKKAQIKNRNLMVMSWIPIFDKFGTEYLKTHCKSLMTGERQIRYVEEKYQTIELLKKSKYTEYIKYLCIENIQYFDYYKWNPGHATYSYLIVLKTPTEDAFDKDFIDKIYEPTYILKDRKHNKKN